MLVLLQPPVERVPRVPRRPRGRLPRDRRRDPGLAERLRGCAPAAKVRAPPASTSYFRRSAGPGWALAGDAGHFKDPVTAQGIRDALRYGRLLGETAAPVLDDPARARPRAARLGSARRERECLEVYQWTNRLARAEAMSPLEVELYRRAARDERLAGEFLEVFCRVRPPSELLTPRRLVSLATGALRRRAGSSRLVVATAMRAEARTALADLRERRAVRAAPDQLFATRAQERRHDSAWSTAWSPRGRASARA